MNQQNLWIKNRKDKCFESEIGPHTKTTGRGDDKHIYFIVLVISKLPVMRGDSLLRGANDYVRHRIRANLLRRIQKMLFQNLSPLTGQYRY